MLASPFEEWTSKYLFNQERILDSMRVVRKSFSLLQWVWEGVQAKWILILQRAPDKRAGNYYMVC